MPLLDIIGVSCFNTTFYACFGFMRKEEEEDYVQVLTMFRNILGVDCHLFVIVTDKELALMNAIQVVFPSSKNLLCVWHIEENILAKCKSHSEAESKWDSFLSCWSSIIDSTTELEFNEKAQFFEIQYKEKLVVEYIKNTLFPFKKLFVRAWIGLHMHFGNRGTSKAEGAH